MKLREIEIPITNLYGVGTVLARLFAKLNIFTVADLLSYYPRDWEDRTQIIPIARFSQTGKIHCAAQIISHDWIGFGGMKSLKIGISDGERQAFLLCFNRSFLENTLPIGAIISISGSFSYRYGDIQSSKFNAVLIAKNGSLAAFAGKPLPDSEVFPIYSLTAGLGQNQIRKIIAKAIDEYVRGIENELPQSILQKHGFFSKQEAINAIHRPKNLEQAFKAKRSLIFEELYLFQKTIIERSMQRKKGLQDSEIPESILHTKEVLIKLLSPRQKLLFERLPFALTPDQIRSIVCINKDIDSGCTDFAVNKDPAQKNFRMARLLQGDVGSGKTLVAFFAALRIIDWGKQCALLAPTEILARQHAENAAKLLEPLIGANGKGVCTAFLTANIRSKGRKLLLQALKNSEIDMLIGTQAVFSKTVIYNNLALVIIDEQHRFGVVQRNAIIDKGRTSINSEASPAVLMMSATPIPQSLALSLYGDLDVSTIKTMPIGRKPIITRLSRQGNETAVYEAVRTNLKRGYQAYFVYPRIESGDQVENHAETPKLKSAEQMFELLSGSIYPEFTCALIHSQIDDDEQNRILNEFQSGKIKVLVATSVVEVGLDVPNATAMVIEQAERFGLAALHQLRGRIGRGKEQSFCFLVYSPSLSELGKQRLKVMHASTDGFFIAEKDMELRGPGDIIGVQQSGYLMLGIADPIRDKNLLELARTEILASIGLLSHKSPR